MKSKNRIFKFSNFVNNFENKFFQKKYDGVVNVENHTFKNINQWAESKGYFVNPRIIFEKEKDLPDFWGGKSYVLDKDCCKILSNNKNNFIEFKDNLLGCEDLCVAYTLKQNGVVNWN